jgi:hypothetical protein
MRLGPYPKSELTTVVEKLPPVKASVEKDDKAGDGRDRDESDLVVRHRSLVQFKRGRSRGMRGSDSGSAGERGDRGHSER